MTRSTSFASALLLLATTALAAPAALAQDTAADQARKQIADTLGGVPAFIGAVSDAALPGLWAQTMSLEMSGDTALDNKTKALISLAVAAQIPCTYCIWIDTNTARQNGATDQEIAEAVAMAGLTRNWSTILNGMQVDFDTFKQDLGGE